MPKRSLILYVNDIIESIEKIILYTNSYTYEDFSKDDKTIDAVLRNFEIIGEAVKNLSNEFTIKYNTIDWKSISGMRDKLIHNYFGADLDIVWKTIENRLPSLLETLKDIKLNLNR